MRNNTSVNKIYKYIRFYLYIQNTTTNHKKLRTNIK